MKVIAGGINIICSAERATLTALLASAAKRWAAVGREIEEMKKKFGQATELGKQKGYPLFFTTEPEE